MIDSIAADPLSSIFEIEAFLNAQSLEKMVSQNQMTGRNMLKFLLQNYVCGN